MQKIIAVGIVGKEISILQKELTVQIDYNVVVTETHIKLDGKTSLSGTLIRVSTIKKTENSLSFIENLKAGVCVYIEGTAVAEFVEKDGKNFTALRVNYTNLVKIIGNKAKECFLKMEQIGYVGNARVNTETKNEHVCNFALAHNVKTSNEDKVIWTNCALWKASDKSRVFAYITRGKLVYITGLPRVSYYETGNGEKQLSLDCVVQNIELLSSAKVGTNDSNPILETVKIEGVDNFEDLPF